MLGRVLVRNTQPMPLTSWPAAIFASLRQVPKRRVSIFHSQNRDASAKMKACREKKQQTRSVGWFQVTLSPCRSPRGLLLVLRRCARHLMERINFPLTKSRRVRKDEGISRKKIAGALGRVVVRNTQPMPLTSRPAGSRASRGSLPHLFSQILLQLFSKKPGMTKFVQSAIPTRECVFALFRSDTFSPPIFYPQTCSQ